MGDKAVEIHNLLLEVGRPFLARLNTFGVLPKRDIQTVCFCILSFKFQNSFSGFCLFCSFSSYICNIRFFKISSNHDRLSTSKYILWNTFDLFLK